MDRIEWVGGGHCNSTNNTRQNRQKIEAKEIWEPYILIQKIKKQKILKLTR